MHGSVAEVRDCHERSRGPTDILSFETTSNPAGHAESVEAAPPWSLEPDFSLPGETGPAGMLPRPAGVEGPDATLDAEQLAAVGHEGPSARIIAPAGSGKTRVLTERARHLVRDWSVPAEQVCLVAFNVRARAEMAERTLDLPGLQVRTLNSLGWAIVRGSAPFARSDLISGRPDTIDETGVRSIIDGLVELPRRLNTDPAASWIDALSAVRLGLRAPHEVESAFGGDVDGLPDVFERYRQVLHGRGVVDFDEQIYRAIEVFINDPSIRASARAACRIMLVDEFQDLTPAHLLLIRLLAGPDGTVFGVGDDDQTIYGYAGATPDWLVDFERFFPSSTGYALETNYRCAPAVVTAATNLLGRNRRRVPKTIRAGAEATPEGGLDITTSAAPVAATTDRVRDLVRSGVPPADVAVLTRVNAALAPVQIGLGEAGIPCRGGVGLSFLDRTGVRASLAWLRLALDPQGLSPRDLGEAVRRPSRGLSPRLRDWVAEQNSLAGLRRLAGRLREDRDSTRVVELADDIEALAAASSGLETVAILELVRDSIGLGATVDRLDTSKRDQSRGAHGDDMAALIEVARLQPDPTAFEHWLRGHLSRRWADEGVELATVHRVKGMEWPHVIVHGVDDGLLPHRLAEDVEEERRIMHVAITRSRVSTTVVANADAPSSYLAELETAGKPPTDPVEESAPDEAGDEDLRERLREYRRDRSRADGVPAYVVFNDRTLDELVHHRPDSLRALGRIHGIGPAKVAAHGEQILELIDGAGE